MTPKLIQSVLILGTLVFGASVPVYATNLAEVHVAKGIPCAGCHKETPPSKKVRTEQCQTCHGDYAALAEKTKNMKPNNAHANHLGDLECRECHQGHKPDKLVCNECHQFKFSMPK